MAFRLLLLLSLLGWGGTAWGQSLLIGWTNPITYTDGSPIVGTVTLEIYRNVNGGPFTLYSTVTSPTATFQDMAPATGSNGYYVIAVQAGASSLPSNAIVVRWPRPASATETTDTLSTGTVPPGTLRTSP